MYDTLYDMAESSTVTNSDVVLPYRFKPNRLWSSSKKSDSNDTNSQVSFTARLGSNSCLYCAKCLPMPRAVECVCCRELSEIEERLEDSDESVTCLGTFKTVCLDKDVLCTALVMMPKLKGTR